MMFKFLTTLAILGTSFALPGAGTATAPPKALVTPLFFLKAVSGPVAGSYIYIPDIEDTPADEVTYADYTEDVTSAQLWYTNSKGQLTSYSPPTSTTLEFTAVTFSQYGDFNELGCEQVGFVSPASSVSNLPLKCITPTAPIGSAHGYGCSYGAALPGDYQAKWAYDESYGGTAIAMEAGCRVGGFDLIRLKYIVQSYV